MCEHPEATWDDYLDQVRLMIATAGYTVQEVAGDRLRCGYAYTIGLTEVAEPELLVTGSSRRRSHELLHEVAEHVLHDRAPQVGLVVPLRDGPVIQLVHVEVPDVHLRVAADLYGPGVRALQVVWQDDRGKWPWDTGHRAGKGGQPVLGTRDSV
jgi:Domain of unknown function (DUF4262)